MDHRRDFPRRAEGYHALADVVRRRGTVFALGVTLLLGLAPFVSAATWFEFRPNRAAPGTVIEARSIGRGSLMLAAGVQLPILLVEQGGDPASGIHLGLVEVDARGDGRASFVVPLVSAGQYEVWIQCEPCRPTSAGRSDMWIGEISVTPLAPNTATEDPQLRVEEPVRNLVVLGLGALLAAIALICRRHLQRQRRRRPSSSPSNAGGR